MSSTNNTWNPTEELCGFLDKDGEPQNLENVAQDKTRNFAFDPKLVPADATGLWHSHPNGDVNLSVEDYIKFLQFPEYNHRIYSKDKYAEYYVRGDLVFRREI